MPETKSQGRGRPAYRMVVEHKETKARTRVGVAWVNEKGWISIKLSPCVVLSGDRNDIFISLYPNEDDHAPRDDRTPPLADSIAKPGDPNDINF
jgi:hypothetical protein